MCSPLVKQSRSRSSPLVLSRVSRLTSAATTTAVAAVLHRCRLLAADAADVRLPRLVDPLLRPASSRRRRPWWLVCECVRERVCVCQTRCNGALVAIGSTRRQRRNLASEPASRKRALGVPPLLPASWDERSATKRQQPPP